jgi:CHAT domain-containing protein/tetratricopeptide (TPR) repeat protein
VDTNAEALIERGDDFLAAGELEQAERAYRQAADVDPDSAEALRSVAHALLLRGDFDAGLPYARRAVAAQATHTGARGTLGQVLMGLGRHRDAIEHLAYAATHLEGRAHMLTAGQVGLCHEALGEWGEAERWLRDALGDDPAAITRLTPVAWYDHGPGWTGAASVPADLHHALARVLQRQGDVEQARLHYHLAKRIDPTVELDPMYLQIMRRDELENHPIDALRAEALNSDEDRLHYLLSQPSYDALQNAVGEPGMSGLGAPVLGTAKAAQLGGDFADAARLWVVVQCLRGNGWIELYELMATDDGRRLMQTAEAVHRGSLTRSRARELVVALELRAGDASALVELGEAFLIIDLETGITFAETAEAAAGERGADLRYLIGDALYRAGRREEARRQLEIAAAHQMAAGENFDARVSLALLSRIAEEQDRATDALALRRRVISLAEEAGDRVGAATERFNEARLLLATGDGAAAHAVASHLLELLLTDPEMRRELPPAVQEQMPALVRATARAAGAAPPERGLLAGLPTLGDHSTRSDAEEAADDARAAAHQGRWTDAAKAYDLALAASEHQDRWPLLIERAMVARQMDEPRLATETLERALEVAYGDSDREREHETLLMLSGQYLDDDPARAVSIANRVLGGLPDDAPLVSLARDAVDRWTAGEHPTESLGAMRDSLLALPRQPPWSAYAVLVARTAEHVGAALLAETVARDALAYIQSDEQPDLNAEMSARLALGGALLRKGDYEQAREELERTIDLAGAVYDLRTALETHALLADVFLRLGRLDRSAVHRLLEVDGADRFGDADGAAVARVNLAHVLLLLGRESEAIDAAEKAVGRQGESDRPDLQRFVLLLLEHHVPAEHLSPDLRARLADLPSAARRKGDSNLWLYEQLHVARRALTDNGPDAAWRVLQPVLDFPRDGENGGFAISSRLEVARAMAASDPARASATAHVALALAEERKTQRFVETAIREILLDCALRLHDDRDVGVLLSRLADDWCHLRAMLASDADRVAVSDRAAGLLHRAARASLRTDPARALTRWDAARAPTLAERIAHGEPVPVAGDFWGGLLALLGPSATLLSVGLLGDEVVAMAATADTPPRVHRPGMRRGDVDRLIATFRREMHTFQGHGSHTWARTARRLLDGAASDLPAEGVVILVVDPSLEELPVHAIALPDGRLLVEHATVVSAPSLSVLARIARRRRPVRAEPTLACVGVAFPDEARAIGIRHGGRVISGNRLDKHTFREDVASADIIHFAGHGRYDASLDAASGLVLTTSPNADLDEIVSLRDLEEWHMKAALVTLSACESGLASPSPSDYLGLARQLLGAGAQAVISALWKIDDRATQAFMLRFYRELLGRPHGHSARLDVAAALRRTQLAEMRQRPVYEWAGFKLTGWPTTAWKESHA